MLREDEDCDGGNPVGRFGNLVASNLCVGERLSKDAFLRVRWFVFCLMCGLRCTSILLLLGQSRVALTVSRLGVAGYYAGSVFSPGYSFVHIQFWLRDSVPELLPTYELV